MTSTVEKSSPTTNSRPQLNALAGFRIVAALMVLFSHYRTPVKFGDDIVRIAGRGYSAVTAFFLLSGLVLMWSQLQKGNSKVPSYRNFMVDRISKIYPLHWFVLAVLVLWMGTDGASFSTFLSHILLVQAWNPEHTEVFTLNSVAWAISVEMFFYVCFPFLFVFAIKLYNKFKGYAIIMLLCIGIAIPVTAFILCYLNERTLLRPPDEFSAYYFLYRFPLVRLGDFIIGMAIGLAIFHIKKVPTFALIALQATAVIAYILLARREFNTNTTEGALSFNITWIPIFALFLFAAAATPSRQYWHPLSTKCMVGLGATSYALYLIHLEPWIWYNDQGARVLFDQTYLHIGFVVGATVTAMVVARFLTSYIEEPAQKYVRQLLRKN